MSWSDAETPLLPPPPPLSEVELPSFLTIIITTSPIRSHPSLDMLEETLSTFHFGGSDFQACKTIIVCDGVRRKHVGEDNKGSKARKHTGVKAAMRSGYVNDEQEVNYNNFKLNLRRRVENAEKATDAFGNTEILELDSRQGYGFALKAALQHVDTKYVIVIQHDRTFMRRTPLKEVVAAMEADEAVKYVGIIMRSNLFYLDQSRKYPKSIHNEMVMNIKRPQELVLESADFGTEAVCNEMCERFPRCEDKYLNLRAMYTENPSYQYAFDGKAEEKDVKFVQGSLIPTLFWYDNIHVVTTSHYRDFVFDPALKLVAKGGFVEDKISQEIVEQVKRNGFGEDGFQKFGCYLLDDHAGCAFTGHIDGGNYLTEDMKLGVDMRSNYMLGLSGEELQKYRIILASTSPRRKELMKQVLGGGGAGMKFDVMASPFDEATIRDRKHAMSADDYVSLSARLKCLGVAEGLDEIREGGDGDGRRQIFIGADTVVSLKGEILEKPVDENDAKRMLRALSAETNKVYTGVYIYVEGGEDVSFVSTTNVTFSALNQGDIDAYVKTGEPMDKAGAYGIQGIAGQFVEKIEGDYFNVVGLPINKISRALADICDKYKKSINE